MPLCPPCPFLLRNPAVPLASLPPCLRGAGSQGPGRIPIQRRGFFSALPPRCRDSPTWNWLLGLSSQLCSQFPSGNVLERRLQPQSPRELCLRAPEQCAWPAAASSCPGGRGGGELRWALRSWQEHFRIYADWKQARGARLELNVSLLILLLVSNEI